MSLERVRVTGEYWPEKPFPTAQLPSLPGSEGRVGGDAAGGLVSDGADAAGSRAAGSGTEGQVAERWGPPSSRKADPTSPTAAGVAGLARVPRAPPRSISPPSHGD